MQEKELEAYFKRLFIPLTAQKAILKEFEEESRNKKELVLVLILCYDKL